MQTTKISFVVILSLILFVSGFMDVELVQSYFNEKMTNYATIVGCFKKGEKFKITKSLIFGKQTLSIFNINEAEKSTFLKTRHNHIGVVLDADCPKDDIKYFLIECGKKRLFGVKHHWLILTSDPNFSKNFEDVELYINADINVAYLEKKSAHYIIEDVYNQAYGKGGSLKKLVMGHYTNKSGFTITEKGFKYELRKNMTGVNLKTIIVLPVHFNGTLLDYLNSDRSPQINTFNRFHYSVMRPCVQYYNFTPKISLSKSWGYLTSDGTFDGLVGALGRKEVDYGSSPLFVRTDRAQVMEYGRRTWTLRAAFLFRNPKSIRSIDIFIKPLSSSVWISLFCTSTCVVLVLKCSQRFEKTKVNRRNDASWSYLIICTTAVFCQQGITSVPFFYSGRILILFMLILSYLIYQFYSACIVSNLLIKPKTFTRSVEDILKSKMKVSCEDTLYNRDYFLYTTDLPSKDLYYQKILGKGNNSNFQSPIDGLAHVRDGGYAFHVELATAYPIIGNTFSERSICEIREVQMYRTQPMHSNLQKYSPFRDMFDTCLHRLAEYGILHREITYWHPKKPGCVQSKTVLDFDLSIDYFYPVLGLLMIGIILSLIVLTFELFLNFKYRVKQSGKMIPVYPFTN